jgi:hypothetical protein
MGMGTFGGEMKMETEKEEEMGEEKSNGYGTVCEKMEYKEIDEEKCVGEEKGFWKRVWECVGCV